MGKFSEGEIVKCYFKTTAYPAKILKIDNSKTTPYFVHYQQWKQRWDEWVSAERLLKANENSPASTKMKKLSRILGTNKTSTPIGGPAATKSYKKKRHTTPKNDKFAEKSAPDDTDNIKLKQIVVANANKTDAKSDVKTIKEAVKKKRSQIKEPVKSTTQVLPKLQRLSENGIVVYKSGNGKILSTLSDIEEYCTAKRFKFNESDYDFVPSPLQEAKKIEGKGKNENENAKKPAKKGRPRSKSLGKTVTPTKKASSQVVTPKKSAKLDKNTPAVKRSKSQTAKAASTGTPKSKSSKASLKINAKSTSSATKSPKKVGRPSTTSKKSVRRPPASRRKVVSVGTEATTPAVEPKLDVIDVKSDASDLKLPDVRTGTENQAHASKANASDESLTPKIRMDDSSAFWSVKLSNGSGSSSDRPARIRKPNQRYTDLASEAEINVRHRHRTSSKLSVTSGDEMLPENNQPIVEIAKVEKAEKPKGKRKRKAETANFSPIKPKRSKQQKQKVGINHSSEAPKLQEEKSPSVLAQHKEPPSQRSSAPQNLPASSANLNPTSAFSDFDQTPEFVEIQDRVQSPQDAEDRLPPVLGDAATNLRLKVVRSPTSEQNRVAAATGALSPPTVQADFSGNTSSAYQAHRVHFLDKMAPQSSTSSSSAVVQPQPQPHKNQPRSPQKHPQQQQQVFLNPQQFDPSKYTNIAPRQPKSPLKKQILHSQFLSPPAQQQQTQAKQLTSPVKEKMFAIDPQILSAITDAEIEEGFRSLGSIEGFKGIKVAEMQRSRPRGRGVGSRSAHVVMKFKPPGESKRGRRPKGIDNIPELQKEVEGEETSDLNLSVQSHPRYQPVPVQPYQPMYHYLPPEIAGDHCYGKAQPFLFRSSAVPHHHDAGDPSGIHGGAYDPSVTAENFGGSSSTASTSSDYSSPGGALVGSGGRLTNQQTSSVGSFVTPSAIVPGSSITLPGSSGYHGNRRRASSTSSTSAAFLGDPTGVYSSYDIVGETSAYCGSGGSGTTVDMAGHVIPSSTMMTAGQGPMLGGKLPANILDDDNDLAEPSITSVIID